MGTEVKEEQFELDENSVTHKPTGARFSAYAGSPNISFYNWGKAGDVLPNGDDSDRENVLNVATCILANRL